MRNACCAGLLLAAAAAAAAFSQDETRVATLRNPVVQRWTMGIVVRARGGACTGVRATVPVPADWPEQRVRVVSEEISPQVRQIRYRQLDGVKQMEAFIPRLGANETAKALVTFEVIKKDISAPADTS